MLLIHLSLNWKLAFGMSGFSQNLQLLTVRNWSVLGLEKMTRRAVDHVIISTFFSDCFPSGFLRSLGTCRFVLLLSISHRSLVTELFCICPC